MVKPTIAVAAGLSVVANDEVGERNRLIKEEKIAKRKKVSSVVDLFLCGRLADVV